jgi:predicted ArsR family transcriptional regulator
MTTTRQKILAHLQKSRSASAREIARIFDLGAANVRHHLSVLLADGRVTVTGKRRAGRGRPEKLYRLSPALAGDNLAGLVNALMGEWLEGMGPEGQAKALASLGRRMAGRSDEPNPSVARRLAALVEKLNALHYSARWEAGAAGPHLILGQCPYAAVIAAHPELCRADGAMLETASGMRAEQKSKLSPGCLFLLRA